MNKSGLTHCESVPERHKVHNNITSTNVYVCTSTCVYTIESL